jgi:hypothetical protein
MQTVNQDSDHAKGKLSNAEILQEPLPIEMFFVIDGRFAICTGFRFNYSFIYGQR